MTDNNSPDTLTQRILVVDDDARLRSLLQRFLEDDGFVVRTAHDGSQMDKLMQRNLKQPPPLPVNNNLFFVVIICARRIKLRINR